MKFDRLEPKRVRKTADRMCVLAAGVFVFVFLAGCRVADKALVLSVQESGPDVASKASLSVLDAETTDALEEKKDVEGQIYVHVCGAVKEPGLVKLPEGSRGFDALYAAGGFAENASESAVNLAEILKDGTQIYFPTQEEMERLHRQAEDEKSGLVNINTADAGRLSTLPGIGEARANDIIAYREANGAFQNIEEIMQVSGIKNSTYEKIKDKITVR